MSEDRYYWRKNYPEGAPYTVDYPDVPLYEFLYNAAEKYPQNTALIFMGKEITYVELKDLVDRFATSLAQKGVKKGDRVAIMLPNSPQAVIAYYGALRIGAVVVQTNPLYVERELEHQMKDSGSETIIFIDLVTPRVMNVLDKTNLKNLIVTSIKDFLPFPLNLLYPLKARMDGQAVSIPTDKGIIQFRDMLSASPNPPEVEIDPSKDVALLQYTGGTTGISKGAMLSHFNLVANAIQIRNWLPEVQEAKERMLGALPFFHVYGMTVAMNLAVYLCSTIILIPRFDIEQILKDINKYRPTLFPGAPTMYVAVISHPEVKNYDISSIVACISGSAALPVEVQKTFESLTGGRLVEGYGLTEASPVTHCNPVFGKRINGSIGLPLADTDSKIVDMDTGVEVPLGEVGELSVKGPQVMLGYWNMPEETEKVLKDGWLLTGDMGRMDEEGYTYIVDRKKDLVIASGFNIYPREVEEVLYEHPKVMEAVVAGVPDRYRGETLKAYIVLKDGETATEEEIIAFSRERLARYKAPKIVEFRTELPKTMVGKVLRRVLVEEEKKKLADIIEIAEEDDKKE